MRGLLVLCVSACARVAAAPPTPAAVLPLGAPLASPDEGMVYEVAFRGLRVARVQVAVGQPGWVDGKRAIIVTSHGETDGLVALIGELAWTLETTIDLETGQPLRSREDATVTFRGKTETNHEDRTGGTHDLHSAVLALRGWRASASAHAELAADIAGAHVDLELHEAGRDWIDKPAVRYAGTAAGRFPFAIWLSDDTARVPLRMRTATKWGDVVVELVDYRAPRDL